MDAGGKEELKSLAERYKLTSTDADSTNWASLLDFKSPVQVESDWYSTQTFQVFLDALDINYPTSLGRDSSIPNTALAGNTATASPSKTDADSGSQNDKKNNTSPSSTSSSNRLNSSKNTTQPAQQDGKFETILSAEALKILSELPDLSHMSVTRSFVFPNHSTNSYTTTTAGKR